MNVLFKDDFMSSVDWKRFIPIKQDITNILYGLQPEKSHNRDLSNFKTNRVYEINCSKMNFVILKKVSHFTVTWDLLFDFSTLGQFEVSSYFDIHLIFDRINFDIEYPDKDNLWNANFKESYKNHGTLYNKLFQNKIDWEIKLPSSVGSLCNPDFKHGNFCHIINPFKEYAQDQKEFNGIQMVDKNTMKSHLLYTKKNIQKECQSKFGKNSFRKISKVFDFEKPENPEILWHITVEFPSSNIYDKFKIYKKNVVDLDF